MALNCRSSPIHCQGVRGLLAMVKRTTFLAACVLILHLGVSVTVRSQTGDSVTSRREVSMGMRFENVRIEAQGVDSLFSKLSLNYDIPVGLEVAAGEDELAAYGLDLREGTLSDLLTQFTSRYNRYAWEIREGVVNVFPKGDNRDAVSRDLLETNIGRFAVKKNTSCWDLARSLADTPEIKQVLAAHGTSYRRRNFIGAYIPQVGREFTLDVSDVALKPLLNKVIGTSPTARFWLITRNSYDRTILLDLNARHEGLPPGVTFPPILQPDVH